MYLHSWSIVRTKSERLEMFGGGRRGDAADRGLPDADEQIQIVADHFLGEEVVREPPPDLLVVAVLLLDPRRRPGDDLTQRPQRAEAGLPSQQQLDGLFSIWSNHCLCRD